MSMIKIKREKREQAYQQRLKVFNLDYAKGYSWHAARLILFNPQGTLSGLTSEWFDKNIHGPWCVTNIESQVVYFKFEEDRILYNLTWL